MAEVVPNIAQLASLLRKLLLDPSQQAAPSAQQLAQLSSLSLLTERSIRRASIMHTSAANLELPELRSLTVQSISISSARAHRASLPRLEVLTIRSHGVVMVDQEAKDVAAIASATGLTCLQLGSRHLRDQHFKAATAGPDGPRSCA